MGVVELKLCVTGIRFTVELECTVSYSCNDPLLCWSSSSTHVVKHYMSSFSSVV